MPTAEMIVFESVDDWRAEAQRLFGDDEYKWKFVCPSCGHVASIQDYADAKAPSSAVAFSCVGRWLPKQSEAFGHDGGPCNYAGGGLIGLNPVCVKGPTGEHRVFEFYREPAQIKE